MVKEIAFNMASSNIRVGSGASREIGMDLADMGVRNVLLVVDQNLTEVEAVAGILESLEDQKIESKVFDNVRIEPTDESLKEAVEFAQSQTFDAFVAVGGGSTIDTAKAANLYSTYPADFLDYVNARTGYVMLEGRVGCVGDPHEILKTIKDKGYEECIKCLVRSFPYA